MRKLWLRIRIAWLNASIMNALQDLAHFRQTRDRAQAQLEEIKYREARAATVRTINALAAGGHISINEARAAKRDNVIPIVRDADVPVLAPGQVQTDKH